VKPIDFEEIRASQEAGTNAVVQAPMNREIIAEFRANKGVITGQLADYQILLLTHVGAKSHRPYVSPLAHVVDGDRIVLVASLGGAARNPSWYFNLVANPEALVEVGDTCYRVKAYVAEGAERERLFRYAADRIKEYDDYQARTARQLPVIVLEPTGEVVAEVVAE
jgi:deazaflavin-dependent oxidoreductase (nitroreductase family)